MKLALSGWIFISSLLSLPPENAKTDLLLSSLLSLPPELGVTEITHIRAEGESIADVPKPESVRFELQGPDGSRQKFESICCSRPASDPRLVKLTKVSKSLGPLTPADWQKLLSDLDFRRKMEIWKRWGLWKETKKVEKIAAPNPKFKNWVNQKRIDIHETQSPMNILVRNNHFSFEFLHLSMKIEDLLNFAIARLNLDNVYYDNDLGHHVYDDEDLKIAMGLLWNRFQDYSPADRKTLITQLPEELRKALTTDSYGLSAETRIELIDLLQSEARAQMTPLLENYLVSLPSLRVFLQNFSYSFLHQALPPSESYPILAFRHAVDPDTYLLFCAHHSAEFSTQTNLKFLQPNQGLPPHVLVKLSVAERPIPFRCGSQEFTMRQQVSTIGKDLPFPATWNPKVFLEDNQLEVLVTLSMLKEISPKSRWMFTKYIETVGGYELVDDYREIKDTRQRVKELLTTTDLFFPVAHQLNLYRMEVAPSPRTQEALYVKNHPHPFKPGETLKVYARVILPPEVRKTNEKEVTFSQEDITEILENRSKQLFAMNVSCHSQQALQAWMEAFRKAPTAASKEELIPIVIGSKRGFQVTTNLQTLGYVDFVAETVGLIAQAAPLKEILAKLAAERDADSFNSRALALFGMSNPLRASGSFEPVSNVHPEFQSLYKAKSIQLLITDKSEKLKLAF